MTSHFTRRALLGAGTVLLAARALAQGNKINLKFTDVNPPDAPRSQALTNIFAKEIGDDFAFQPFWSGTLFKQGTELVAVQRGNADMALLPPSDFAQQVPAFDILGAAYVVRDKLPWEVDKISDFFFQGVMALPYHIYVVSSKIPQNEYTARVQYGAAFVFLFLVATIALASILLRNRMRNLYKW